MIAKKNPKVDLEGKRVIIFNVGLLVAGSFTLAAFTYSNKTYSEEEKLAVPVDELVIFEVEEKVEKPEIVKDEQPQNQIQTQDPQNLGSSTGISENMIAKENGKDGPKKPGGPGAPGIEFPWTPPVISVEDKIVIPKINAAYIGGLLEMKKQIIRVQEYPDIDIQLGNQGTVYVSFIVEKDGSVTDVKTERGVSKTLDREAVRIVETFPKWKPGEDEYGVVRTRVRLPITFVLEP